MQSNAQAIGTEVRIGPRRSQPLRGGAASDLRGRLSYLRERLQRRPRPAENERGCGRDAEYGDSDLERQQAPNRLPDSIVVGAEGDDGSVGLNLVQHEK